MKPVSINWKFIKKREILYDSDRRKIVVNYICSLLNLNHLSTSHEGKDGFFMQKNEKIDTKMIDDKNHVYILADAKLRPLGLSLTEMKGQQHQ